MGGGWGHRPKCSLFTPGWSQPQMHPAAILFSHSCKQGCSVRPLHSPTEGSFRSRQPAPAPLCGTSINSLGPRDRPCTRPPQPQVWPLAGAVGGGWEFHCHVLTLHLSFWDGPLGVREEEYSTGGWGEVEGGRGLATCPALASFFLALLLFTFKSRIR